MIKENKWYPLLIFAISSMLAAALGLVHSLILHGLNDIARPRFATNALREMTFVAIYLPYAFLTIATLYPPSAFLSAMDNHASRYFAAAALGYGFLHFCWVSSLNKGKDGILKGMN